MINNSLQFSFVSICNILHSQAMREKKETARVIAHFRAYEKLAGFRGSPASNSTFRK